MFQNGISRNTKCAERDGFHREGHKFCFDGDVLYMWVTTDPQLSSYEVTKSNVFIFANITSLNVSTKVASF